MIIDALKIEKLTGLCSIQDEGRDAHQHLGFSGSGAADLYAFYSANQLLGNNIAQPALEILMGQISFKALNDCQIALTGADCQPTVNGNKIPHWQCINLQQGDLLELNQPQANLMTYVAIKGKIVSQSWLNSQSQTLSEQKLGFGEAKLAQHSIIKLSPSDAENPLDDVLVKEHAAKLQFYSHPLLTLRFNPRPLWHKLKAEQQNFYLNQSFSITANSNRMGYRLTSNDNSVVTTKITEKLNQEAKLSMPVCYGTIQLPDADSPLILMKERQTIGGYPTLGTVMQTDMFRLSQMRPGEQVKLIPTSITHAQMQLKSFLQKFR